VTLGVKDAIQWTSRITRLTAGSRTLVVELGPGYERLPGGCFPVMDGCRKERAEAGAGFRADFSDRVHCLGIDISNCPSLHAEFLQMYLCKLAATSGENYWRRLF
jgi:hypothetical protein